VWFSAVKNSVSRLAFALFIPLSLLPSLAAAGAQTFGELK
jgi:hypothetical protein